MDAFQMLKTYGKQKNAISEGQQVDADDDGDPRASD